MIEKAKKWIEENNFNVYQLTEYVDGKTTSVCLQPGSLCKNLYSVSKTVTATAIAMLATRGVLSVNDKMVDYLGKYLPERYDPKLERVTLKHLLTHTAGQERGYMFEKDRRNYHTNDWLTLILSQPLALEPGERMVYSNSVYYLLSRVVEEVTGKTLFDFLREELFVPLDFKAYAAGTCPLGHTFGASDMYLNCDDMCKIGQIYLNGGKYDGKEYIAKEFVEEMHQVHASDTRLYGYSFWMNRPNDAYYGDGAYGQVMLIIPKKNAVFTVQSYDDKLSQRALVDLLTL